MRKNVLDGAICYLIGPIDEADDKGVGWRRNVVNQCRENNLHIKFLDPTNKISGLQKDVGEEQGQISTLKRKKMWDELSQFMEKIVHEDHRCVDICDFVIVYIDTNCRHLLRQ